MAIDDTYTVDAAGIEPGTGQPLLIISDHLDWSDPVAHLNLLQLKLNAYIGFIKNGQLDTAIPGSTGLRAKIGVLQQFQPPENIVPLLDGLGEQLATVEIDFSYGPLPEGLA